MSNLVIVESPAKAKTIGKYLGSKYKVKASMGHLRDLPKSELGVDIEGGFIPKYIAIKGKGDLISELRKLAKASDMVYLATDPDREGEAISWHLKELLKLNDENTKRVTFNEITKKVVTESMKNPREIDKNLVDAQQARRVLDRIVGYKLSPLLWKKIRRGLSAGRVQSIATRLVCDKEAEVLAFIPREYWSLDIKLDRIAPNMGCVLAHLHGNRDGKLEPENEEQTNAIIAAVEKAQFEVSEIKKAKKQRSPAPPFITSTLQQEASRKLNMAPKRTMAIAQQLYEGVEIAGQGTTGLITYMRTDSLRLSDEAVYAARDFIKEKFGEEYCPKSFRVYKSKGSAQDAHEAIRPTYAHMDPEEIKGDLTPDQYKLYKIIWSRFIACQMENAVYDTISIDISADEYIFRATSSAIVFKGFSAVYAIAREDEEEENSIPDLKENEKLDLNELVPGQHFTLPPARYTEASLIRAMEENGVGRPSTYAPTISTILDREYVIKDGRNLKPTPLGEVVNGLMVDKFKDIVDVEFTAHMEETLDEVEAGKISWKETLKNFYESFAKDLEQAEIDLKDERLKVPDEVTDVICELCGKNMVVKSGRFGKFLACPGYPDCKNTKPIVEETPGVCPTCGGKILKKKSKNGYYYFGCEKFPDCKFMTWDVPQADKCQACGHSMYKRSGRGEKKIFCANPECSEYVPQERKPRAEKKPTEKKETAKKNDG
ncbi:MAG: type I DNA topoisomerase [Clostridia bacterium]